MLEQQKDHIGVAVSKLLQQFKGKPNWTKFFSAIVSQVQDLEDTLFDLYTKRWIDTASGAQLDVIGRIVAERREGSLDEEYRMRIAARIRVLLSSGTVDELLDVFYALKGLGGLSTVQIEQSFPAGIIVRIGEVSPALVPLFMRFLVAAKVAGVYAVLVWSSFADDFMFTCSGGSFLTYAVTAGQTACVVMHDARLSSSGLLLVDAGTSREEVVTFTKNQPPILGVSIGSPGFQFNHDANTTVEVFPGVGLGWSSTVDNSIGGHLAGAIGG